MILIETLLRRIKREFLIEIFEIVGISRSLLKEMLVHNSRATMRNNIGDLEKETWTRVTDSGSGQPEKFGDIELQQLLNENQMQTQEASCAINLGRQVTSNASNRQSLQYAIERTIRTICIHEGIRDSSNSIVFTIIF